MESRTTQPIFAKLTAAIAFIFAVFLVGVVVYPPLDLIVSGFFFTPGNSPGQDFLLDYNPLLQAIHTVATYGAWVLGAILLMGAVIAAVLRKPFLTFASKTWLFLFLAIVLVPGLFVNNVLKDHWGRARPATITEFSGPRHFSPALIPQPNAHKNGSFVAGDAAFGFYLACFGYAFSGTRSRRVFWSGIGAGVALSLLRISMGAHFFSDTLFAALVVLSGTAVIHALMFGRATTVQFWRNWFFRNSD